jgi:hypothetical protein
VDDEQCELQCSCPESGLAGIQVLLLKTVL